MKQHLIGCGVDNVRHIAGATDDKFILVNRYDFTGSDWDSEENTMD